MGGGGGGRGGGGSDVHHVFAPFLEALVPTRFLARLFRPLLDANLSGREKERIGIRARERKSHEKGMGGAAAF